MAAYVIYQGEVIDPDRYEHYKSEASASIAAAGGTYLVQGGEVEVLEGAPPPSRTVVVEFANLRRARLVPQRPVRGCQEAAGRSAVRAAMYIVEGV